MRKVATIGFFDGVHCGHRYLFDHLRSIANERELSPLIVTFDTHPRAVLQSDYVPHLLTTLKERKALLREFGELLVLPFTEVQPLTAAQFMERLHRQYDVEVLLMGYDHQFGSDRLKHPRDYRRIGQEYDIEVLTFSEYVDGEWHVSSTEIRQALENGNIAVANELLGRPYTYSGTVVHGKGIGRTLGFPTANIAPDSEAKILPKPGVYAVSVRAESNNWLPAMMNIGTNPTLGNNSLSIEVYIPGFQGDLYDRHMDIRFTRFIREEKRFDTLQELKEQIAMDVDSSLRPGV